MDLRKSAALGMLAFLLTRSPLAVGQQADAAPVNPALPTFATLWAEYERRFLIAASKTDHSAMAFIGSEAPPIAQSVLGSSWPLVRDEALRRLNVLPAYDTAALDAVKWEGEYSDIFEPFAKPTPAHLAAARLWDPAVSLTGVTMTVLTEHLQQQNMRDDLLIAANAGMHSYRATWRGKTALVAEYGYWLVAMEYMLTKEGMFVPVRAAMAHRQL